jgi:hypothetical protein
MGCVDYPTVPNTRCDLYALGVFAGAKKIYKGTFIGIYSGELLTDAEGEERGLSVNRRSLFSGNR